MRKLTTEEFIQRSKDIWGNKYDYSLVEYNSMKSKVKIIYNGWIFMQKAEDHLLVKCCELRWDKDRFIFESKKIHGDEYDYSLVDFKNMKSSVILIKNGIEYLQRPEKHLAGNKPDKVRRLISTQDFIEKSRSIWGYKYDYSLVDYKGSNIEVLIKYKGEIFRQKPMQHLLGYKCERNMIKNGKDFLKKCLLRHGDKYDYSLVEYKGMNKKIKIIYNGEIYEQRASAHLYLGHCEKVIKKKTTDEFIIEANEIHNFRYNYSKVNYENNQKKVKIICNSHGEFQQVPSSHLSGAGCPSCCESKGEKKIAKYLKQHNIEFLRQYKFDGCVGIRYKLPFDFYIPSMRTAIEFDGIQHFQPVTYFGGVESFERLKINDKIKEDYCEENYINLIRIRYDQIDDIYQILWENLKIFIKK
jgi:very-short-patch-repair endonuclease/predicted heme/steroid binding protein